MIWKPVDLKAVCTPHATVTTCQPSTFMFLQLVISLFGKSKDNNSGFSFKDDLIPEFVFPPEFDDLGFNSDDEENSFDHDHEDTTNEFDFIVVGAGTAGCLVANRLSAIPSWKVLLLEAGGEEPEAAEVPSFATMMQRSSIDWNLFTQPQSRSCLARPQRRCSWPRGKVMGGSSAINYMIYLRGGPKDFDEWAEMGNTGWSYHDVLPYFKKTERNGNIDKLDSRFHSTDGDLNIEYFQYQDQNVYHFLHAFKELGLHIIDQNSDRQLGASLAQQFTRDGRRFSSNAAFIRPIRNHRENFVLKTNAYVTKVLINPHTKLAYGVEYIKNGKHFKALAKKEVIVSAGTLLSPKILMLSGIGPAWHLQHSKIKVLQDLKVGHNLHDHTTIDGPIIALSNLTSTLVTDKERFSDTYKYKKTHRGPFAATATLQVNSFIQTKYEFDYDRPDVQFTLQTVNVRNFYADPILASQSNVDPVAYYDGVILRPILLIPRSRGFIRLNYSDPVFGDPLIYANTFHKEEDLSRIVDGLNRGINIAKTHTLKKIGAKLITHPYPACNYFTFGTDNYWRCISTSYTTTLFHPVGTCKMGPKHDPDAVVDPSLKVYGIKHLRVIDASIMPVIVRANVNAATTMIAEKGADLVIKEWYEGQVEEKHYIKPDNWFDNLFKNK